VFSGVVEWSEYKVQPFRKDKPMNIDVLGTPEKRATKIAELDDCRSKLLEKGRIWGDVSEDILDNFLPVTLMVGTIISIFGSLATFFCYWVDKTTAGKLGILFAFLVALAGIVWVFGGIFWLVSEWISTNSYNMRRNAEERIREIRNYDYAETEKARVAASAQPSAGHIGSFPIRTDTTVIGSDGDMSMVQKS
jgi:hypothetical protein